MGRLFVGPGVDDGDSAIFNRVSAAIAPLPFDVTVISWNRPGATVNNDGKTPSRHDGGFALDLRPAGAILTGSSPCGGSQLSATMMSRGDQIAEALRAAGLAVVLWRTCTGGNHYDHVHTDDGPGGGSGSPETGSQGSGGLGALTSGQTWLRIAEAIAGGGLVIGAIILIGKET